MVEMYKKIILGVDDSEGSMNAVEKVLAMQKENGAEVVIFHSVLHHITDLKPAFFGTNISSEIGLRYEVDQDRNRSANKLLDEIKQKFTKEGLKVDTRIIYDFGPQYYIEDQVKKEGFDLVVLGCKGEHSKLRRTVIGTVPEYVINHVNVDLLIAK